jgi:hypothetical protein
MSVRECCLRNSVLCTLKSTDKRSLCPFFQNLCCDTVCLSNTRSSNLMFLEWNWIMDEYIYPIPFYWKIEDEMGMCQTCVSSTLQMVNQRLHVRFWVNSTKTKDRANVCPCRLSSDTRANYQSWNTCPFSIQGKLGKAMFVGRAFG